MTTSAIHRRISSLVSFRELKRRFDARHMRQIKRFIAVSRKGHVYLANTYFIKNVVIIYHKKHLAIFKLFRNSLTLPLFLNELQKFTTIDFERPNTAGVEEIDLILKMVVLLMREKFIVPLDFDEYKRLKKYRAMAFSQKEAFGEIYIIPSAGCNLACPDCVIYSGKTTKLPAALMTPKVFNHQWNYILKFLPKKRRSHINFRFFGGEPLLNKTMVEYAARKILAVRKAGKIGVENVDLQIVTNGTLIDKATAIMFKKYNIAVIISLDGIGASNDAQRIFKDGRGTFDAIMRGVSVLEMVGVPYTFSWTIGPKNIDIVPHDLKKLIQKFNEPKIYFNIMIGSKDSSSPFGSMTKTSFFRKLHRIFDTARALGLHDRKLPRYMKWRWVGIYPTWFECAAVTGGSFALRPDGKIGICPDEFPNNTSYFRYPEDIGDINKDALSQRWRERTSLLIPECYEHCEYVTYCSGGCPHRVEKIVGNIYAVAEETCRIKQFYIKRGIIEICEAP